MTHPEKILAVGMNYMVHIKEMGREPPDYPAVFIRYPDSLVGHGQLLVRPRVSEQYDYEGELAVIIGKPARYVAAAEALSYVAGYTCLNDGSIRDFQRHGSQFTPGKNFPCSGACGPWMVTADEIPDPSVLELTTRLNDAVVQQSPISDMRFSVPDIIAYCSTFTTLQPGDIITTGTPGGVGAGDLRRCGCERETGSQLRSMVLAYLKMRLPTKLSDSPGRVKPSSSVPTLPACAFLQYCWYSLSCRAAARR